MTRADAQQITALADDGAGGILLAASNPGGCSACRRSRRRPAPTSRTSATRPPSPPGARSAGRRRCRPARPSRCTRAAATPGRRMRPGARGRGRYTTALGTRIESPKARYLQWKAVLTGANGASPVLTSVSAAYLPRNTPADRRQRHRAPAGRGVPAALPHRRSRAGRHRRHARRRAPPCRARRRSARRSAAARSRRACRRSSGRRATRTAIACSTRWPTAAKATGRGPCSRTASTTTCSPGTRRRCRTAPTCSR